MSTERVSLDLGAFEADALRSAAEYLRGLGRVFEVIDDARYQVSDLLLVARTLDELHARAFAEPRAA